MADSMAAVPAVRRAPAAAPAARPKERSGVLLRRVVASFVIAPPVLLGVYAGGELDWLVWEYWNQALPSDDAAEVNRRQLQIVSEQVLGGLV